MIDEFPAFAISAVFGEGDSIVRDAQELHTKESDRIQQLVAELTGIGVKAEKTPDGFIIHGGGLPRGGSVDPHGDHRLAMALALAGLSGKNPVTINHAAIINESFPEFPLVLHQLGADIEDGNRRW